MDVTGFPLFHSYGKTCEDFCFFFVHFSVRDVCEFVEATRRRKTALITQLIDALFGYHRHYLH